MDTWDSSQCIIIAIACQHGCTPGMSLSVYRDTVAPARPSQNSFWWEETDRPVFKEGNSPQHFERLKRPQLSILKTRVLYTKA